MTLPSLAELDIAERRVLIRVDFDVPLSKDGSVMNDRKILNALPTIRYAMAQNARIIIASSLGSANGRYNKKYSLEPIGGILSEKLNTEIFFPDNCVGEAVKKIGADMQPGQIMLLENLEFHRGELENSPEFAKRLAECADVYVNEAFSLSDRKHASINSIFEYFENICLGFQFSKEIESLDRIKEPEHPFAAIFGGSDVSEKLDLMEGVLEKLDTVMLGGVIANTFLLALGGETGKSKIDETALFRINRFISSAETRNIRLVLPQDLVAVEGDLNNYSSSFIISGGRIPENIQIVDIGPAAQSDFEDKLSQAKTVLWAGPMGICENAEFRKGTESLVRALERSETFNVIVGQDTVEAAMELCQREGKSFLSHSGRCSIKYITGDNLPALHAMEEKNR